jgi:hypothetical protein
MLSAADGSCCQQALLDAIRNATRNGAVSFSAEEVMEQTVKALNAASDDDLKRVVLGYFNELLRTGVVGLGNAREIAAGIGLRPPWPNGAAHLTPQGEETLRQASRDPINLPGYLAYLDQETPLDPITRGYVEEALNTYRACCYKATAVLIGAAVEKLVLALRDELVARLDAKGITPPKGLEAWQVKTALEAAAKRILHDLASEVKKTKDDRLRKLLEDAEARLAPIAAEFRRTRNDAGHPASLAPVNPADVHCNLLLFPSTAKVLQGLTKWITEYYS